MRQRENALYLVYKIVRGPNFMALVLAGEVFKDGVLQGSHSEMEVMTA
jgi:hypothetical protein